MVSSSQLSICMNKCGSPVLKCSCDSQEMTKFNVNKTWGQYFRVNVEMNYTAPSTCYIWTGGTVWSTNTDGVVAAAIKKPQKEPQLNIRVYFMSPDGSTPKCIVTAN